MKEALFILLVIAVLLGVTAIRYRRQITMMLEFWRVIKAARSPQQRPERDRMQDAPAAAGKLVNCPKCGTWVPEEKAIRLGRSGFYCSTKCLEASRIAAG